MTTQTNKALILHPDNPFKEDVERMFKTAKIVNRSTEMVGPVTRERITMTVEREYLPIPFTKMYQDKESLLGLAPDACKILIYIACTLEYGQQKIVLTPLGTGVEKRRFSRAIVQLIGNRVLVKEKREHYWVNITLLVVGTVGKPTEMYSDEASKDT